MNNARAIHQNNRTVYLNAGTAGQRWPRARRTIDVIRTIKIGTVESFECLITINEPADEILSSGRATRLCAECSCVSPIHPPSPMYIIHRHRSVTDRILRRRRFSFQPRTRGSTFTICSTFCPCVPEQMFSNANARFKKRPHLARRIDRTTRCTRQSTRCNKTILSWSPE